MQDSPVGCLYGIILDVGAGLGPPGFYYLLFPMFLKIAKIKCPVAKTRNGIIKIAITL